MHTHGTTYTLDGISARPLRYELSVERGLPSFCVLGLPEAAARESRERIRAALINSGFEFPPQRIVAKVSSPSPTQAVAAMDLAIAASLSEEAAIRTCFFLIELL